MVTNDTHGSAQETVLGSCDNSKYIASETGQFSVSVCDTIVSIPYRAMIQNGLQSKPLTIVESDIIPQSPQFETTLTTIKPNQPRHEKNRIFACAKTKAQISCAVTAQLISAFVFATRIVQSFFCLNPKFQASSLFPRLCRSVCDRPGRKSHRLVFLRTCSNLTTNLVEILTTNLAEILRILLSLK